jgi:CheY-like chemotaxis protein
MTTIEEAAMALDPRLSSATHPAVTVLIVDDNDDIRETLLAFLEDEGFAVASASSGAEALALLKSGLRPAFILLDMAMPEMSGFDVLERLRSDTATADIPVAIMSGSFDGAVPSSTHFLRKPFDLDRLMGLIHTNCYRNRTAAAA